MQAQVHETAVIDDDVELGQGARVWHFAHVSSGAVIGRECVLGQNVFVGRGVQIGERVRIQNNVSVYSGVEVAAEAFLGPSCVFTNVVNPRSFVARKHEFRITRVGRGASIGANATIICGNDIGDYALVGAGAVVTHDVPRYAVVVGNPARQSGWVCRCGVGLGPSGTPGVVPDELVCPECATTYRFEGGVCGPST